LKTYRRTSAFGGKADIAPTVAYRCPQFRPTRVIAALLAEVFVELQKLNITRERFGDVERFRQRRFQRMRRHTLQELNVPDVGHCVVSVN
jgi:hypothetical protein